MSIHITDKLTQGNNPVYVGSVVNEVFPGTSLSAYWVNILPTGATVNNSLIIASGLNTWARYITFLKLYMYEKQTQVIEWTAVTKNTGDAWGLHMSNLLVLSGQIYYLKFDGGTGVNSGCITVGFDDVTALNMGVSQAINFAAGDNLRVTIIRTPRKTQTILENLSHPNDPLYPVAYGEFENNNGYNWGTQGYLRLTFLGGQQTFTKYTIYSKARNYSSLNGVLFIGDSITAGSGSTSSDRRWSDVVMKSQQHLYENVGINAWVTTTVNSYLVNEVDNLINAKYVVVNIGYNDAAQALGTSPYSTALTTLVTTLQSHGRIVILVSLFPHMTIDNKPYSDVMQAVAVAKGCKFVDAGLQFRIAGNLLNPTYVAADAVHPNDTGHLNMGTFVSQQCPELLRDVMIDFAGDEIRYNNLPVGLENQEVITINHEGRIFRTARKFVANLGSNYVQLLATTYTPQPGNFWIAGNGKFSGNIQSYTGQFGFNDGVNSTSNSNLNITNAGVGGIGFPQVFDNITGFRNVVIRAVTTKAAASGTIAGSDQILIQTNARNSGAWNIMINADAAVSTSGVRNLLIGKNANVGASGDYNIQLLAPDDYTLAPPGGLRGSIIIGSGLMFNADAIQSGDISIGNSLGTNRFWFGGRGNANAVELNFAAVVGLNQTGAINNINASRGTGLAESGVKRFRFPTPGTTGSTLHSVFTTTLQLERQGVTIAQVATPVRPLDLICDIQSTAQGFRIPSMSTTQRDAITGILSIAFTTGTGYTNGIYALTATGGTGSGFTGYIIVASAGAILTVVITNKGSYTVVPTIAVPAGAGAGTGMLFTPTIGMTDGNMIYNITTHKLNIWTGTAWEVVTSV